MRDLKIPDFLKKERNNFTDIVKYLAINQPISDKSNNTTNYEKETDDTVDTSEIPLVPTINNENVDIYEEPKEATIEDDLCNVKTLTEAEKDALRKYMRGMDEQQLEFILEYIPMSIIIRHFDKKWNEAEKFRRNIAIAMDL